MENKKTFEKARFFIEKAFGKKNISNFEEKLLLNCGDCFENFLEKNFFRGILASIAVFTALILLKTPFKTSFVFSIASFFAPLFFSFFCQQYFFEKSKKEKENHVPDVLLTAASFPEGSSFEKIIDYIGKNDYGLLSVEFKKASLEIKKGNTVENALNSMKQRNKSRIIDRMACLLIQGYNAGGKTEKIFRETAEDLLETNAVLRERSSAMIVEKYTLLLAGGLIVPLVLGLIVSLVSKMNFSFTEISFGLSAEQRKALFEAALFSNQAYLLEYSVIASAFASFQDNDKKNFLVYCAILAPLSFAVYSIAKSS